MDIVTITIIIIDHHHTFTITHPHPLTMLPLAPLLTLTPHRRMGTLLRLGDFPLVPDEGDIPTTTIIITHVVNTVVAVDTTIIHVLINFCNVHPGFFPAWTLTIAGASPSSSTSLVSTF